MNITIQNILAYSPCEKYGTYDKLKKYFQKSESVSEFDILDSPIPALDKIWILTKNHFLTHKSQILFALFCIEECMKTYSQSAPEDANPETAISAVRSFIEYPSKENQLSAQMAGYPLYSSFEKISVRAARNNDKELLLAVEAIYGIKAGVETAWVPTVSKSIICASKAAQKLNKNHFTDQLKYLKELLRG